MPRIAPQHDYFLIANKELEESALAGEVRMREIRTGVAARQRPARLLYEQVLLPSQARRLKLDVLFNPGFTAPALAPCPCVTTFHDLQHKRHPEYFRALDLPAWNFFLGMAARHSARILCVSDASAADFRRYYPHCAQPVDVTPLGARADFFALGQRQREESDFLLCVSTLHPHKNQARLVRVFARWRRERGTKTRLVLAGMRGFAAGAVERAIADSDAAEFVTVTGWIDNEQLLGLYRDAKAFLFPSLFEGFGIPVVEAMASGLPVAVSDLEPMRSITRDAALRFDARNEEAMLRALDAVLLDEPRRQELRQKAVERAREFTWERTARLTLASLEAAAG